MSDPFHVRSALCTADSELSNSISQFTIASVTIRRKQPLWPCMFNNYIVYCCHYSVSCFDCGIQCNASRYRSFVNDSVSRSSDCGVQWCMNASKYPRSFVNDSVSHFSDCGIQWCMNASKYRSFLKRFSQPFSDCGIQ